MAEEKILSILNDPLKDKKDMPALHAKSNESGSLFYGISSICWEFKFCHVTGIHGPTFQNTEYYHLITSSSILDLWLSLHEKS